MAEERQSTGDTWNQRVKEGRDKVPGGIHD
jgi:hypothetical protein